MYSAGLSGCGCGAACKCGSRGLSGLGDICVDAMCYTGQAAVQQMDSIFQALDASLQPKFQAAHDAVMQSFGNAWSWYTPLIPYNSNCCAILNIGTQATALANQMQAATGGAPLTPPTPPPDGSPWPGAISAAAVAVVALVGYLLVRKVA